MKSGTAGRNRTDTPKERDFESRASTNSATAACFWSDYQTLVRRVT